MNYMFPNGGLLNKPLLLALECCIDHTFVVVAVWYEEGEFSMQHVYVYGRMDAEQVEIFLLINPLGQKSMQIAATHVDKILLSRIFRIIFPRTFRNFPE